MSYCAVYLNRIHREKNLPEKPEDPLILEKSIPYDAEFTFIDFVPSVLTYSSSAHHQVEYHRFRYCIVIFILSLFFLYFVQLIID